MTWSVLTLLAVLVAVSLIWLVITARVRANSWSLRSINKISIENDLMKILVPILSLVIAIFSYGSASSTAGEQLQLAHRVAKISTEMADFRGELRFKATYNNNWTLTLTRIDDEPFSINKITLTPAYQKSPVSGPVTGEPVNLDPLTLYQSGARQIVIPRADRKACEKAEADACQNSLKTIFVDFIFGGAAHRVVAYHKPT